MKKQLLLCLLTLASMTNAYAMPYIPSQAQQVLETLPTNSTISSQAFRQLRAQLSADPRNTRLATQIAKTYIERAREEGDPRYLGYAQAALAPWWTLDIPPEPILVLRATLYQSTHQFNQALTDIDKVIKLNHSNAQAWITRATILQVQGQYAEALKGCEELYSLAPALITLTCTSNIHNLSGHAKASYLRLKLAYSQADEANPDIQVWVLTLLAEMATRLGDIKAAEQYFQQAMQIDNPDSYLLGAYTDFLLDQHKPQEVIALLSSKTRVDSLLLRYAEALDTIKSPAAPAQIENLKQRFTAATLRGDTVHQREQSRFELRLMHNPERALSLAKLNWQIQKEPADARVYLEAAIASKNKEGIQAVIHWLAINHQEDAVLITMLNHYQG